MGDRDKTKRQLVDELAAMRQRFSELEAELRLKENALDNSLNAVAMSDMQGKITYVNQACMRIGGWSTGEELIGKPYWELIGAADVARARDITRALLRDHTWFGELRGKSADGTEFDGEVLTGVLKDSEGNPVQTISSFVDITERKKAEVALRESEQRFRIASQLATDLVYERDMQTGIATYYGDIDSRMGYGRGEFPRSLEGAVEHVHPEDLPRFFEIDVDEFNAGKPVSVEYRRRKRDGTYSYWLDRFAMIRNEVSGDPEKLIGVATDVTERRTAELALRQSEERHRLVSENARDIIWTMDMDLHFTYVSPSVEPLMGYSVEESMGRRPDEFLNLEPETMAKALDQFSLQLARARAGEKTPRKGWRLETEVSRKDGSRMWVDTNFALLRHPNDQPVAVLGVTRDVTERKMAEEALRESGENFRALAENSLDGIAVLAEGGIPVYANKRAQEITGYTFAAEPLSIFEYMLHPEAAQELVDRYRRRLEGQPVPGAYETEIVRGDLTTVSVEVSATRTVWKGADAVMVIFRDITDRKQAEGALLESEERYRLLVNNSDDLVASADLEGNILFANPSSRKFTGYEPEEAIGRNFAEFVHPDDVPALLVAMQEVLRAGIPEDVTSAGLEPEFRLVRKDGSVIWARSKGLTFQNREGNIVGFTSITRDVTERKQAEQDLRESEERFRMVLDNSVDVIYRFNLETSTYDYYSPASRQVLGYSPGEWMALGFDAAGTLVHHDDIDRLAANVADLLTRPGDEDVDPTCEYRFNHRVLGYRWVSDTRSVVLDDENRPTAVVGVLRDITERRLAEEALKEYSERLETMVEERTRDLKDAQEQLMRKERLAVLGQLAGGVGHELRNPLGAIKNAAYYLNAALEQPEPEVKEALQILGTEVAASERIIGSLLDFARRRPPARRAVNVNQVVEEALSRVGIPDKIEVIRDLKAGVPTISADPEQLSQVLGNIILNAAQAMPEGGQLTLRSGVDGPGWVAVSIADTGVGMNEDVLKEVFEPLFTTKAKGIGLGLALSKMLVEAHGGSIEAESEVGRGSTFTVRLPVASGQDR